MIKSLPPNEKVARGKPLEGRKYTIGRHKYSKIKKKLKSQAERSEFTTIVGSGWSTIHITSAYHNRRRQAVAATWEIADQWSSMGISASRRIDGLEYQSIRGIGGGIAMRYSDSIRTIDRTSGSMAEIALQYRYRDSQRGGAFHTYIFAIQWAKPDRYSTFYFMLFYFPMFLMFSKHKSKYIASAFHYRDSQRDRAFAYDMPPTRWVRPDGIMHDFS